MAAIIVLQNDSVVRARRVHYEKSMPQRLLARFRLDLPLTVLGIVVAASLYAQDGAAGKKPAAAPPPKGPVDQQPVPKKVKKKAIDDIVEVLRVAGELTAKDPIDKRRGAYCQIHEVKMAPGKTYVIRMLDKNAGGSMDPYLRLEDSRGTNLAEDDDGEGNLNSRIEYNPPREDTYKIYATTLASGRTGKYLLLVEACLPGRLPPRTGFGGKFGITSPNSGGPQLQSPAPFKTGDLEITMATFGQSVSFGNNYETHGYYEYRFTVKNRSDSRAHQVTVIVPAQNHGTANGYYVQALRNTVDVPPGGTAEAIVLQPDLLFASPDGASVEVDGRLAEQRVPVNFPQFRGSRTRSGGVSGGGGGPSYRTVSLLATSSAYFHYEKVHNKVMGLAPLQIVAQQGPKDLGDWSTHWLGYSSFDSVMIEGPALQGAPAEVQAAIWQFVECGGSLLLLGACKLPESWERTQGNDAGFTMCYPGFGCCLVADRPPADWSADQAKAVNDMWVAAQAPWHQITNSSDANRAFPVVDDLRIPVRGLFVVMILFVVLIGPVNIYWLSRARRRIWLLWTVPVIALLTCFLLVGYMIATEGWHGHVRSTSITVLDEKAQRAATIGWMGFYCPTTPGGGLHFSRDTELSPHLDMRRLPMYSTQPRQPCSIDWSRGQHLTDGWIAPKVPLHFLVRRGEKRLERLTVRENADGSTTVVNSLGADIRSLWVARSDGVILIGHGITPGPPATLTATTQKCQGEMSGLNELFALNWLDQAGALAKNPAEYLRPGCYVAVIDNELFLDQGLGQTQSRQMQSIVFGIMKGAP
jgi:hypothetical protein